MWKCTVYLLVISFVLTISVACNNSADDSSQSMETNINSNQQKQESDIADNTAQEISTVFDSVSDNAQSNSISSETYESTAKESSVSDGIKEQYPKISTIHLEDGGAGPLLWEADVTDESDVKYIYESLQNMEPAGFYDSLAGGYAVMVSFTDDGGNSFKYLVTATDSDIDGYVLAYNTDILENPANIKNYDKETKYYKWFNVKNDIWAVIQKYGECPFQYVDGKFIEE